VRDGRFEILPQRFVQAGPQIGNGLARVARILHPNAFR